jgi:addiction module HigA family antidote
LKPLKISQHKLALEIRVPATRIGEIVHRRRAVTPETSLRLARYFGTSPEFWLNLQQTFDLSKVRAEQEAKIAREVRVYAD